MAENRFVYGWSCSCGKRSLWLYPCENQTLDLAKIHSENGTPGELHRTTILLFPTSTGRQEFQVLKER